MCLGGWGISARALDSGNKRSVIENESLLWCAFSTQEAMVHPSMTEILLPSVCEAITLRYKQISVKSLLTAFCLTNLFKGI